MRNTIAAVLLITACSTASLPLAAACAVVGLLTAAG
jgi:hypothetical protein